MVIKKNKIKEAYKSLPLGATDWLESPGSNHSTVRQSSYKEEKVKTKQTDNNKLIIKEKEKPVHYYYYYFSEGN